MSNPVNDSALFGLFCSYLIVAFCSLIILSFLSFIIIYAPAITDSFIDASNATIKYDTINRLYNEFHLKYTSATSKYRLIK